MKKVKLMLVSLSILAVVGGALAFTAKTGDDFCVSAVAQGANCANIACPNVKKTADTSDPTKFLCTAPLSGDCSGVQCAGSPINKTVE